MFKFTRSYIIILARLSGSLSITIDILNRESVRALRILLGFHGPDQPHQRSPPPALLPGTGAPSQLSPGSSVPARATSQEHCRQLSHNHAHGCPQILLIRAWIYRLTSQRGPRPASLPQTCLMICTLGWSWLPSPGLRRLGIRRWGWLFLPRSAPGYLSFKEQPDLTTPSHK